MVQFFLADLPSFTIPLIVVTTDFFVRHVQVRYFRHILSHYAEKSRQEKGKIARPRKCLPCHFQAAPALAPQLAVGSSPRQGCTDFSRRIAPSQKRLGKWNFFFLWLFLSRPSQSHFWAMAQFLWLGPEVVSLCTSRTSDTKQSANWDWTCHLPWGKIWEKWGKMWGKIWGKIWGTCKSGELRLGLPTPVRWSGNKFCASLFTWLYLPRGPRGSLSEKFEWQRSRTKEPVIHDVEDALEAEATQMRADPRMEDGSIWIKPSHQHPSTTSVHSLQLAWMYWYIAILIRIS